MATILYAPRPIVGQSFVGVKRETVPKQSLSLREIVRRFVRRENLPVSVNEGIYESRFGDLEKLSKLDMVEQFERRDELRSQIEAYNVRAKAEAESAAAAEKLAHEAEIEKRINDAVAARSAASTK